MQIVLASAFLLYIIYIGVTAIGKAEYDKSFCESKLDLLPNEKPGLLHDQKNKRYDDTGEVRIGCCRIPDGAEYIRKSTHCIYTTDYIEPELADKWQYFLKRFK